MGYLPIYILGMTSWDLLLTIFTTREKHLVPRVVRRRHSIEDQDHSLKIEANT